MKKKMNIGLDIGVASIIKIVVIDYLQLLTSDKESLNKNIEISNITRDLKLLSRKHKTTFWVLSN